MTQTKRDSYKPTLIKWHSADWPMFGRHSSAPKVSASLRGIRVLITGASSGIGAATARELAARGALIAVAGRDVDALHDVMRGFHSVYIQGDLREPGCAERTVEIAADAFGGLDVVMSNAGIGWYGPFTSMSHEDIDAVLDVNLRSSAHLIRAALPHLRGGGGRIVLTGSIAGSLGVSNEAWYSATKAALTCFAEVLRAELKDDGIGVTLVIPGVVDTQFFIRRRKPYPRRGPRPIQPTVVAEAIANAIKNNDNEVVMPGWLWLPILVRGNFPRFYRQMESYFI